MTKQMLLEQVVGKMSPASTALYQAVRNRMNDGYYSECWVNFVCQHSWHHGQYSLGDAYVFAQVFSALLSGWADAIEFDTYLDDAPKDRENAGKKIEIPCVRPFRAVFDDAGGCSEFGDGFVSWDQPIILDRAYYPEKPLEEVDFLRNSPEFLAARANRQDRERPDGDAMAIVGTNGEERYFVSEPPGKATLEIGFTEAATTYQHLTWGLFLARFPYGSNRILLLRMNEDWPGNKGSRGLGWQRRFWSENPS